MLYLHEKGDCKLNTTYMNRSGLIFLSVILFFGCNQMVEEGVSKKDLERDVELITDFGTIIIRLSDDTPEHRNNFIRLVNMELFDGVLFHRVIDEFLVQTGDPNTRPETEEGASFEPDLDYMVPAEFTEDLFHRRGAVNAARSDNPARASSSSQFTIIQGRVYNDSTLAIAEGRINDWLRENKLVNNREYSSWLKVRERLIAERPDSDSITVAQNMIEQIAERELAGFTPYTIPAEHREVYKTEGGAAHLDQNYTVFGVVLSGMEIVDRIAGLETDEHDRPFDDVRIITARMIDRR